MSPATVEKRRAVLINVAYIALVLGAFYLAALCILPEILIAKLSVPFVLGGTTLLIVVQVTMDFITQVQSHLIAYQYEGLLKKASLVSKRKK